MKKEIFNDIVDRVVATTEVSRDQIFVKCKKREVVDARQMICYLCSLRGMKVGYITSYFDENGYHTSHRTTVHSIQTMAKRIKKDFDLASIIKQLQKNRNH